MISPGASFFSLYGDGIKDRYEDCLKAQGLIRMPCEISIELQGSFSTTIDWILQERKKILLSYYKPDNEGKRFKQVSSCKI